MFIAFLPHSPMAIFALFKRRYCLIPERRSGRKPGARVTNFVLAEFKVVARGS